MNWSFGRCAIDPPAPDLQKGLAQGSVTLTNGPITICIAVLPPAPGFHVEEAFGAGVMVSSLLALEYPRKMQTATLRGVDFQLVVS
jgi:hypothetical protein